MEVIYKKTKLGIEPWTLNNLFHREDGPAYIEDNLCKIWFLNGTTIWNSDCQFDLTNKIILSKTQHLQYPTVQVWKIFNKDEVYEQVVIPGMEEFIIE